MIAEKEETGGEDTLGEMGMTSAEETWRWASTPTSPDLPLPKLSRSERTPEPVRGRMPGCVPQLRWPSGLKIPLVEPKQGSLDSYWFSAVSCCRTALIPAWKREGVWGGMGDKGRVGARTGAVDVAEGEGALVFSMLRVLMYCRLST